MMGKKFYLAMALVCILICLMSASVMAVPGVINYQGKLTNTSDCVLTGTYKIKFSLYAGGVLKWEEEQTVAVDQGLFDVKLGSVETFPVGLFENDDLDLEMVVQDPDTGLWEPLSPRQRITSVAYAIKADHAATATNAGHAGTADSATNATNATKADTATKADSATEADHATTADNAINATNAGHAATSGDADTVDGKHASELLDTSSDTQTKAGGLNISGNVGVGTESPSEKLTVAGTIQSTLGGVKFPDGSVQTTAAGTPSPPIGTKYSGSLAPGQSFSFNLYNAIGGMLSIAHQYKHNNWYCSYGGVALYLVQPDAYGCWPGVQELIKSVGKNPVLEISFPSNQVAIKNTSDNTVQYIINWFGSFNLF